MVSISFAGSMHGDSVVLAVCYRLLLGLFDFLWACGYDVEIVSKSNSERFYGIKDSGEKDVPLDGTQTTALNNASVHAVVS